MQADAPVSVASQTMFFPRLRRQAKWVFASLALVFALGFVVFGVGSGGGIGLGDLFDNNGNTQGSVSESGARDRVAKNPNDAEAYRNLATALQTKGDIKGAVAALEKYTKLRPRSVEGQTTLAGLYTTLGSRVQPEVQAIQTGDTALLPAFNSGVRVGNQTIVEPNRVFEAVSNVRSNRLTELLTRQQENYTAAEKAYQRVARLQPRDAPTQLGLAQAAQQAGDTTTAIAAYRRFVQLAPDDPTSAIVKQQIRALQQASTAGVSGG